MDSNQMTILMIILWKIAIIIVSLMGMTIDNNTVVLIK